jgi:DnaK suppressor protein
MTDRLILTDMADTAADLHDTVVERAVQGNIVRQLEQVNETLARIDDGKYGICADCLQPIAADRLVVRPFSTLCMDCQNHLDRGRFARS